MENTTPTEYNSQEKYKNPAVLDAAKALLTASGFDVDDVEVALQAIKEAKTTKEAAAKETGKYKNYKDKCNVYDDVDAFIYRRGDTKSGIWYLRIVDSKTRKPVFKSLKTKDFNQALASARVMYRDLVGKIERGERLRSITPIELCDRWLEKLKLTISSIPHRGITPDTYKHKKYFIKNWKDYMKELNLTSITIDRINPQTTRDFCNWLSIKPKETALHTGKGRSYEQINNNANEVLRMYHQLAVRDRYVSEDRIPQIDRLKYQPNDAFKRDIFNDIKQYGDYIFYLNRVYTTKKHNPDVPPEELEKRKIFTQFILILANAGFRSKELLGIKRKEIYVSPKWNEDEKKEKVVMVVRADNSKTGKERRVVAPCAKHIRRIEQAYKKLGIIHEPDDYLFINAAYGRRTALGRMIMYQRLKKTLIDSGIQKDLDKAGKSISPYSFRHWYAYMRLIHGVSIHLLAQNMGTSVGKIESTYGHIDTELHSDEITKGQGIIKSTETSILTEPVIQV